MRLLAFLAAVLLGAQAWAASYTTLLPGTIATGGTFQLVLCAPGATCGSTVGPARNYPVVWNNSASDVIYVYLAGLSNGAPVTSCAGATQAKSIQVNPGPPGLPLVNWIGEPLSDTVCIMGATTGDAYLVTLQ